MNQLTPHLLRVVVDEKCGALVLDLFGAGIIRDWEPAAIRRG